MDLALSTSIGAVQSCNYSTPESDPGEDPIVTLLASGSINAHRVVTILASDRVAYCDAGTPTDRILAIGITLTAAADGEPVQVQKFDRIVEPSWDWTPGLPIYCGLEGALTQVYDAAWAFVAIVGVAIDRTSMWVRLQSVLVQI